MTIEINARPGWHKYTLGGVEIVIDRFHETPRSLYAEIVVRIADEHRLRTEKDLLSDNGKASLSRRLRELYSDEGWDEGWDKIVEWVAEDSVRRFREGAPVLDIGGRPPKGAAKWRLYPIVPEQMPAMLFGAGAALKSWIAMAMSISIQTGQPMLGWMPIQGNVLWLDYEMSADEANERMQRLQAGLDICPGEQLTIRYKYCDRAFADLVPELLQEIAENNIKMIVLDSLIAAIVGSSFTDENIRPLFKALRSLGTSSLIISHVNQQQKRDTSTNSRSTYGNVFIENWCRQMFDVRASEDEANPRPVVMVNTKYNLMAKLRPMGYDVNFDDEVGNVSIQRRDIVSMPSDVASRVPLGFRIVELLKRGAMSASQIAEELAVDEKQVGARLGDMKKTGRVLNPMRGTWGLAIND